MRGNALDLFDALLVLAAWAALGVLVARLVAGRFGPR